MKYILLFAQRSDKHEKEPLISPYIVVTSNPLHLLNFFVFLLALFY